VSTFVAVTVAPGTGAPELSLTLPRIVPVATCAAVGAARISDTLFDDYYGPQARFDERTGGSNGQTQALQASRRAACVQAAGLGAILHEEPSPIEGFMKRRRQATAGNGRAQRSRRHTFPGAIRMSSVGIDSVGSGAECDTFESTASSTGVMQPNCLARIMKFQSGSNFFQPAE
jgi:hypothetical protein